LKECTIKKKYMNTGTFAKGKKCEGDPAGKVTTPILEEKAVMSIYGSPPPISHGASSSLLAKQSLP
jgi:hypothetical protein